MSPQEPDQDVHLSLTNRLEAVAAASPQEESSSTQTVKLPNEQLQRLEILLDRKGSLTEHRTSKQTW